jgi:hypothetical protein
VRPYARWVRDAWFCPDRRWRGGPTIDLATTLRHASQHPASRLRLCGPCHVPRDRRGPVADAAFRRHRESPNDTQPCRTDCTARMAAISCASRRSAVGRFRRHARSLSRHCDVSPRISPVSRSRWQRPASPWTIARIAHRAIQGLVDEQDPRAIACAGTTAFRSTPGADMATELLRIDSSNPGRDRTRALVCQSEPTMLARFGTHKRQDGVGGHGGGARPPQQTTPLPHH